MLIKRCAKIHNSDGALLCKYYFCPALDEKLPTKKNRTGYLPAIISIGLVLFSLGMVAILILQGASQLQQIKDSLQLVVFIDVNEPSESEKSIHQQINRLPGVKHTHFVSKQAALDSLIASAGKEALAMLGNNPLPATVDVQLAATHQSDEGMEQMASQLRAIKGITEVVYQRLDYAMINHNIQTISLVILTFAALLLLISFSLINNAVRLTIYARRFIIKSMQLVGATRGFIQRPFLATGLINGLYGSFIGCTLLMGILYLAHRQFPDFVGNANYHHLLPVMAAMVLLGVMMSIIFTWLAVNRYLRSKMEDLY
ncbi:MAG: hypothetical protein RIQ89_1345 [Bacteroidota bacterium]